MIVDEAVASSEKQLIYWGEKRIATWSHAFSRAWRRLRVFASRSHWFIVLFTFVVICHKIVIALVLILLHSQFFFIPIHFDLCDNTCIASIKSSPATSNIK